jgi:hypothetical protein
MRKTTIVLLALCMMAIPLFAAGTKEAGASRPELVKLQVWYAMSGASGRNSWHWRRHSTRRARYRTGAHLFRELRRHGHQGERRDPFRNAPDVAVMAPVSYIPEVGETSPWRRW